MSHFRYKTSTLLFTLGLGILFKSDDLCVYAIPGGDIFSNHLGGTSESMDLDTDEQLNHNLKCPHYIKYFQEHCQSIAMSCNNRCGSFVYEIPERVTENSYLCSCDDVCKIYGDCCLDYEDQCPVMTLSYTHFVSKYTRLRSAKSECVMGVALLSVDEIDGNVIDLDNNDHGNGGFTHTDYRKPVVSVKGLQFQNVSTLSYFFQGSSLVESAVTWRKSLNFIVPTDIKTVENYLLYGNASENAQMLIEDVAPFGIRKRRCPPKSSQVRCRFCHDITYIHDGKGLCHRNLQYSTTAETPTHSETASVSTFTTSTDTAHISVFSNEIEVDYGTGEACVASFMSSDSITRGVTILFSITMSMSTSGTVDLDLSGESIYLNDKHWQGLDIVQKTDEDRMELIKICHPGFIFNKDDCAMPKSLRIDIVYSHNLNVGTHTDEYINAILKSSQGNGFKLNTSSPLIYQVQFLKEQTGNKGLIATVELSFKKYNLTYDGKTLPIRKQLRETIDKQYKKSSQLLATKDNQIIFVCLVTPASKTIYNKKEQLTGLTTSICDQFIWNGNSLSVKHLRLNERHSTVYKIARETALKFTGEQTLVQSKASSQWRMTSIVMWSFVMTIGILLLPLF